MTTRFYCCKKELCKKLEKMVREFVATRGEFRNCDAERYARLTVERVCNVMMEQLIEDNLTGHDVTLFNNLSGAVNDFLAEWSFELCNPIERDMETVWEIRKI